MIETFGVYVAKMPEKVLWDALPRQNLVKFPYKFVSADHPLAPIQPSFSHSLPQHHPPKINTMASTTPDKASDDAQSVDSRLSTACTYPTTPMDANADMQS